MESLDIIRFLRRLLLLLFFSVTAVYAQQSGDSAIKRFDHLNTGNGLIDPNVSAIVQDDRGFLWFATTAGLNRWDGYTFTEFLYQPFETNSLPHSQIQTMYKDSNGYIWIGTYGGLSRLDPMSFEFRNFLHDSDDSSSLSAPLVISILVDSKDRLWVGTGNGLNMSENGGETFSHFPIDTDDPTALPDRTIRDIHEDEFGAIWIAHYAGISRWVEGTDRFVNYASSDGLSARYAMDFEENEFGDMYIGFWEGFVTRYNADENSFSHIQLPVDGIYKLMFTSEGELWVATWTNGLFVIDPASGTWNHHRSDTADNDSISDDLLYSLFQDDGDIIWVGSRGSGLNKYDPKRSTIAVYKPHETQNSISRGEYTSLAEDRNGYIWVGTHFSGLDRLDVTSGQVINFPVDPSTPENSSDYYVREIFIDRNDSMWVLSQSGLALYDPGTEELLAAGEPFTQKILNTMIQDQRGNYWIGTYNNGLIRANANMSDFDFFQNDPEDSSSLGDNLVSHIFQDSLGNIWFGTNDGLDRWDDGRFEHFRYDPDNPEGISDNKIDFITEGRPGILWIGTNSGGLNIFDIQTGEIQHFTTRDGLPSNNVESILRDHFGNMWISTTRGLVMNDGEGSEFVTFGEDDGLLDTRMSRAALRSRQGTLYFGSSTGIQSFEGLSSTGNQHRPKTVITSIRVSGEIYTSEQEPEFPYQRNFIQFEYSALDYTAPDKNRFIHRLIGLDDSWSAASGENIFSYANLSPGDYRFEVRASNNDGVWSSNIDFFEFTISPPWYLTPFPLGTMIVFSVIFLFILYNFYRMRWQLNRQKLQEETRINKLLEKKVQERTIALSEARQRAIRADAAKSRFLANISHDIRTPLNSIIGFSELIINNPDIQNSQNYAKSMHTEGKKLLHLINQILDVSKIESGTIEPEYTSFNLRELVYEISASYSQAAVAKGLFFTYEVSKELPDFIVSDQVNLERVLDNLLSNCLKFTNEGFIDLKIQTKRTAAETEGDAPEDVIHITVSDTGIGIPKQHQARIFQSFEQLDSSMKRNYSGTGLGMTIAQQLVKLLGGKGIQLKSDEGSGTSFEFEIPLVLPSDAAITTGLNKLSEPAESNENQLEILNDTRLLLVEDYQPNQEVMKAILSGTNAKLDIASEGEQAIALVKEQQYQLIIMDLHMPGMDGIETTRRIRATHPLVPILGVTADVLSESRESCIQAGMTDVIYKPVRRSTLAQAAADCLNGSSAQTANTAAENSLVTILDYRSLLRECGNDQIIAEDLIQGFIEASLIGIGRIKEALEQGNFPVVHRESHSMKGGALNIMAGQLAETAALLERMAKTRMQSEILLKQNQDSKELDITLELLADRIDDLQTEYMNIKKAP